MSQVAYVGLLTLNRRLLLKKKLKKDDGVEVEEEAAKAAVITNYFRGLFTSCAGTRMDELLQHVVPRVTAGMNEMLMKEYTAEEVMTALKSIGDLKAPGLDGMRPFSTRSIGILWVTRSLLMS